MTTSSSDGSALALEYCDAGWDTAADACPSADGTQGGVAVVAATGSPGTLRLPAPLAPGGTVTLRLHLAVAPDADASATVTTGVDVSNHG